MNNCVKYIEHIFYYLIYSSESNQNKRVYLFVRLSLQRQCFRALVYRDIWRVHMARPRAYTKEPALGSFCTVLTLSVD